MTLTIHIAAALWVLLAGLVQLLLPKGTGRHRALGWSWMLAMLVVSLSSFGMPGFADWLYGYGPIHLLSVWVLICVAVSVASARFGYIRRHRAFAVGAYLGTVGAALGALLVPGRLLHGMLFG
ncbi:DUF2306 domain-containing protein [Marinobacterium sedimentorum]|uniref:DUF2306 domain-containing protein n=1 Tax=Marinobacterium sedimentorum TaxID=2927804 RepID=UPI0020C706CD|nr:DUF2306 domain-containing protein [Marinobacterium sedimentorum]MCP8688103.1 DUF2306 domain-containing protein [Marinobacterium sedimentorum]